MFAGSGWCVERLWHAVNAVLLLCKQALAANLTYLIYVKCHSFIYFKGVILDTKENIVFSLLSPTSTCSPAFFTMFLFSMHTTNLHTTSASKYLPDKDFMYYIKFVLTYIVR